MIRPHTPRKAMTEISFDKPFIRKAKGETIAMATMYDRTLGMFYYNITDVRG